MKQILDNLAQAILLKFEICKLMNYKQLTILDMNNFAISYLAIARQMNPMLPKRGEVLIDYCGKECNCVNVIFTDELADIYEAENLEPVFIQNENLTLH